MKFQLLAVAAALFLASPAEARLKIVTTTTDFLDRWIDTHFTAETELLAVEGVKEAAVIGTPDEVLGQAVKAFVIPEGGVTLNETELKKECQRRLESFMVPKYIAIVESLPRTDTGKIKKIELF